MASTSTKAFSGSAVSPSVERVDAATHLAIQVLPSASSETRSKQINAYNTSALSLLAGASSSHDEVMTSDEPKPPQSSSLANQRCPLDALATLASSAATLDSDAKNTSCSGVYGWSSNNRKLCVEADFFFANILLIYICLFILWLLFLKPCPYFFSSY
uniref:Uncharacterized protein n=1 Tax=Corethron hystrix TaxID=216773 RepID=A0A6U5LEQ9_9STRA